MDEAGRIALIARMLAGAAAKVVDGVEVGIGDDAAVLRVPSTSSRIVFTVDEQVDETHFRREWLSWQDIGWRSFQAAASDVAAMGARPWCALCSLVLPSHVDDAALEQIVCGQRDAAAALGAPVVGGNLARGATLSITTTLLGLCDRAVTRNGAKVGDGIWLAGAVGLAACGLRALERGAETLPDLAVAVAAWRRPHALVAEGLHMAELASAAIDVSDGLAGDLGHVAQASGVRAILEARALLADPALAMAARALSLDPIEAALYGGEDYALIAASRVPIAGFRRVGAIEAGEGVVLRSEAGDTEVLARGFDHFAK